LPEDKDKTKGRAQRAVPLRVALATFPAATRELPRKLGYAMRHQEFVEKPRAEASGVKTPEETTGCGGSRGGVWDAKDVVETPPYHFSTNCWTACGWR